MSSRNISRPRTTKRSARISTSATERRHPETLPTDTVPSELLASRSSMKLMASAMGEEAQGGLERRISCSTSFSVAVALFLSTLLSFCNSCNSVSERCCPKEFPAACCMAVYSGNSKTTSGCTTHSVPSCNWLQGCVEFLHGQLASHSKLIIIIRSCLEVYGAQCHVSVTALDWSTLQQMHVPCKFLITLLAELFISLSGRFTGSVKPKLNTRRSLLAGCSLALWRSWSEHGRGCSHTSLHCQFAGKLSSVSMQAHAPARSPSVLASFWLVGSFELPQEESWCWLYLPKTRPWRRLKPSWARVWNPLRVCSEGESRPQMRAHMQKHCKGHLLRKWRRASAFASRIQASRRCLERTHFALKQSSCDHRTNLKITKKTIVDWWVQTSLPCMSQTKTYWQIFPSAKCILRMGDPTSEAMAIYSKFGANTPYHGIRRWQAQQERRGWGTGANTVGGQGEGQSLHLEVAEASATAHDLEDKKWFCII